MTRSTSCPYCGKTYRTGVSHFCRILPDDELDDRNLEPHPEGRFFIAVLILLMALGIGLGIWLL